jgi:dolichyl-phosphate beta-glucosyltransferase
MTQREMDRDGSAGIQVSVVIPAYNESKRLPPYLAAIRAYFQAARPLDYEVIVVDDGSGDGLSEHVGRVAAGWPQLSVLRHTCNQGKGAAIRTGVLAASGGLILLADADGATPIEEEAKLRSAIGRGADIAVGSRLAAAAGVTRSRACHRRLFGRAFAWLARRLLALPVRDTQCGFKMLRRGAGQRLIPLCREPGYLLDLELLAWARALRYRVAEVAVSWAEVPGSKLRLVRDGWAMFRGLWRIRHATPRPRGRSRQPGPEGQPALVRGRAAS